MSRTKELIFWGSAFFVVFTAIIWVNCTNATDHMQTRKKLEEVVVNQKTIIKQQQAHQEKLDQIEREHPLHVK